MFFPYYTKKFDDTSTRITKLVGELDSLWFRKMVMEFEKQNGGKDYAIDHTPENYEQYLQSLSPEERYYTNNDFIEVINFKTFCYSSSFENGSKNIVNKIIETTTEIISDAGANGDYTEFKSLIEDVKVWVKQKVEQLQNSNNKDNNIKYLDILDDFQHKCIWSIDYYFNNKMKALERKYLNLKKAITSDKEHNSNNNEHNINDNQISFSVKYETESLKEVLLPDIIPKFIYYEKRLLEEQYIDNNCSWTKSLDECAALINKFLTKEILRHKKTGYEKWVTKTCKPFFEKRYNIKFSKQMQPTYRKQSKLSALFTWIQKPE